MGTARGLEMRLVPEAGFRAAADRCGPAQERLAGRRACARSRRLPASIVACRRLIREFQPRRGASAWAATPQARRWRRRSGSRFPPWPLSPTPCPAWPTGWWARRVQAAAVNFPAAAKWFRNAEVTGIPVRPEFFSLQPPTGAAAPAGLWRLAGRAHLQHASAAIAAGASRCAVPGLTVLHQSGLRNAAATAGGLCSQRRRSRALAGEPVSRRHASSALPGRIWSCRAAAPPRWPKLAAAGKPALLVPFAAATDEHQRRNAEAMVAAGAAVMLQEKDLEIPGKLLETLIGLLTTPARLAAMAAAARTQAHPGAAERIADRVGGAGGRSSELASRESASWRVGRSARLADSQVREVARSWIRSRRVSRAGRVRVAAVSSLI